MADPVLVLVCAVATLGGVPGMLLYGGGSWRRMLPELSLTVVLWLLIAIVGAMSGVFLPEFAALIAAMGIVLGTGVATALAEWVGNRRLRLALLAGFAVLVLLPLALAVFWGSGTWLYRDVGALDFAGALPSAVGAGGFLLVLALVSGKTASGERVLALRGAMLLAVATGAAAIGFELRVDELTPAIALNMLMTPALAMLAAAGIERIQRGANSREGLAAGTLAGTAAALGTCAYLETVTALILGLVVGAIAEAAYRGASVAWRLATPLLVGGVTGLLYLGIFGLGPGFVYSGQPVLLGRQALVTAIAVLWSVGVSTAMLVPLRRVVGRAADRAACQGQAA